MIVSAMTSVPTGIAISENITFLSTGFKMSESYFDSLPDWILAYKPQVRARFQNGRCLKQTLSDQQDDLVGRFFGRRLSPVEKCYAPGLEKQLALIGFVPSSVIVKRHSGENALSVNIRWGNPMYNDSEESAQFIQQCQRLFNLFQWERSWSVYGKHFAEAGDKESLVLNFGNPQPSIPSLRPHIVSIEGTCIVAKQQLFRAL
jgi:hypothetical protein